MKLRELKLSTRITVSALIIVAAGAALLAFVENARIRDAFLRHLRVHLESGIETETLRLNQTINTLRQDVLFLSNTPPVSGILRATLNHGYDARDDKTRARWEKRLQEIFSAFSIAHPDYYQIRYIGVADGGREIVRIDNRGKEVEITPPDRLQAKGDRDYFKAALALREGQVTLSEFNLNQEWGVIEQPHRPTLRATTPVFTPTGKFFGMVVINMNAGSLLKSAESDLPGIQTYITNMEGQYLIHPDSQQAFQFELGSKNNITTDFYFITSMFNQPTTDYLPLQAVATKPDSPLFAAKRIYFDSGDPQRFLLLMHYMLGAVAAKQIASIPAQTILYELMAILLIGGIAMLVLRRTFSPLERITAAADRIAAGSHDILLPPYSSGEIGSLTKALNTMLAQLAQREKLLQESEVKYRRLHESMMDAFVMTDMSGRLIEFNRAYQEMLGYSAKELLRLNYADLTPEKWREFEAQIVNEQVIPHGKSPVYEKEYIRKDGAVFPVELRAFLLRDKNNQPEAMWAIVRDITERKRVNHQLQELSAHLLSAREEEKSCIAREIHDDLGGTLAALKMDAYRLSRELSADKAAASLLKRVDSMSQLLDNAVSVTRRIITDLRPALLDDLGLLAALEWQAEQFQKRTGISCRVNCVGDKGALDKQHSIALFRIFQEALTNVTRHSGASRVEVEYHCDEEEVMLSITDNGRGLPKEHAIASASYGMRSMSERAGQLGGKIRFDSPPGGGFSATVILPLLDKGKQEETS